MDKRGTSEEQVDIMVLAPTDRSFFLWGAVEDEEFEWYTRENGFERDIDDYDNLDDWWDEDEESEETTELEENEE